MAATAKTLETGVAAAFIDALGDRCLLLSLVGYYANAAGLTAKAAMVGFTNSLARDAGPDRIRVNAIAPGMIITPRQRALWFQDESQIAAGLSRQCLPDLIAVEDVANLALFLAADDSRSITKQCFMINGGSR